MIAQRIPAAHRSPVSGPWRHATPTANAPARNTAARHPAWREPVCLFVDDIDRGRLYRLLRDTAAEYGNAIHAYVFMGDHIHVLLTAPGGDALPRTMCKVGQCGIQAFNHRHVRSGPLRRGRFKSCIVGTERYLMAMYRYIELNPGARPPWRNAPSAIAGQASTPTSA